MAAATTRTTKDDSVVYNRGTKVSKAIIAMEIGSDDLVTGGAVVPICELPAEAIVTSIKYLNDDLDTAGANLVVDLGLYKTTKGISLDDILGDDSNTEVLDVDIFADGLTVFQAAVTTIAEALGSGTNAVDLNDRFETVRVLGGVSIGEDPFKYFLGFKPSVSAGATVVGAGVYFEIEWVQG